jgi:hypothetical protein
LWALRGAVVPLSQQPRYFLVQLTWFDSLVVGGACFCGSLFIFTASFIVRYLLVLCRICWSCFVIAQRFTLLLLVPRSPRGEVTSVT